jgi:hypothetical protein
MVISDAYRTEITDPLYRTTQTHDPPAHAGGFFVALACPGTLLQ